MHLSEAALVDAWNQVVARYPFPALLDKPAEGNLSVARTVARYLPPGSRVLDFGAGPAEKPALLSILGYKCTAIDDLQDPWHKRGNSRERILDFADEMGIEFIVADGEEIPTTTAEFDMVMLHHVLEHLHDSPRELLIELLKRVRTGGYLFATMPNHTNLRKRLAVLRGKTSLPQYEMYYWHPGHFRGHVREYTRGDCIALAHALELELVEVQGVHHMLEKVPPKLRRAYLAASRLAPSTRDTWSIIARKPEGWSPKLEMADDEYSELTGLKSWGELTQ